MIVANHAEMSSLAERVSQAADVAEQEIDSTQTQLSTLTEAFQGATATAFEERYAQWNGSAHELVDGLRALGAWLQNAADVLVEHDQASASTLRG